MIIYLRHPTHGEKIATLEAEAKADEARGWTRFNPLEVKAPSVDPIAAMSSLQVMEKRKPGRPRLVK